MTNRLVATFVAVMLAAVGCGKSKSAGDGGGTGGSDGASEGKVVANVMVSGIALPHPLSQALDPGATFSNLQISVVDPSAELAGMPPLASGTLNTSDCAGSDGGTADAGANPPCPWSFPSVDIGGITLGLVVKLEDLRATGKIWVKTGTGAGTAAFIAAEKISKTPITGRQAFAVSRTTQAGLATLASAGLSQADAGTITGDQMEARGYMIGHVTGKMSAGAPAVAGATVAAGGTAAAAVTILYPNETFNGLGAATSSKGLFLVVPKAAPTPTPVVTSWTVTPPTGTTNTWSPYIAGTQPGAAFVIILLADE
jgi:hypothetical protein